jgi:uncharacterized protein affecting Mg2+/Co2+ transport
MTGSYQMVTEDGEPFEIDIPAFSSTVRTCGAR